LVKRTSYEAPHCAVFPSLPPLSKYSHHPVLKDPQSMFFLWYAHKHLAW